MASCKDTETQSDFSAGHLWFLGTFRLLERLGILFFDRLALPSPSASGRARHAVKLHSLSGSKNHRLVARCSAGIYVDLRSGFACISLFNLGKCTVKKVSSGIPFDSANAHLPLFLIQIS